jgi:hypothetical protein
MEVKPVLCGLSKTLVKTKAFEDSNEKSQCHFQLCKRTFLENVMVDNENVRYQPSASDQ